SCLPVRPTAGSKRTIRRMAVSCGVSSAARVSTLRPLPILSAASSTSWSPPAATCKSMPSVATASLLSRCQNSCRSGGMRIVLALATLLLASSASAQEEYATVREVVQTCTACHGDGGASKVPENPILAGQQYYYLYLQLKDFKSGARHSDIMGPLVQPLQPEQMKLLAPFFSTTQGAQM